MAFCVLFSVITHLFCIYFTCILLRYAVPFANRTADVDLPFSDGQARVTVKVVIDDFKAQMPEYFTDVLEAFVLLSPRLVRVTCRNARNLEDFSNLTCRASPVIVRPCRTAKWVNLTRLS